MDLPISVFLLFILFTAGHSLDCYKCMGLTGSCADQTIQTCPSGSSMCESSTTVVQVGDISSTVRAKDCAVGCLNGSINFGVLRMTSSCCNRDLCNTQDTDPSTNVPNGKTCYSCDGNSCLNIMNCSGTEDRCVKATATSGGQSMVAKGCVSKSICDATASIPNVGSVSCCEGNMCNGAPSVSQSFLFLCCSLLSYFLLH